MKYKLICLIVLSSMFLQTGCLYAVRYDGPYHGKVVDEQTRKPIEGAVVLGWWMVHHFGLGGGYGTYHDAKEVVTDKDGEFTIPGQGLRVLSSLEPMDFLIYKAGYTYYKSPWESLKVDIHRKDLIKWEGETPLIPLRKLTDEERRKDRTSNFIPTGGPTPENDAPLMTREINKERVFRGWGSL